MTWAWEIRSVNGRGLDIKTRIADGFEACEPVARKLLSAQCKRGSIAVGLKVKRANATAGAVLNEDELAAVIAAAQKAAAAASAAGLAVAPVDVVGVLSLPGVFGAGDAATLDMAPLVAAAQKDLAAAVQAFADARKAEGAALAQILGQQVDEIARLCDAAAEVLGDRRTHVAETLKANIVKVLENTDAVDEARLAQELAIVAVKADVAEELDRLGAHIKAARVLLATDGPIGRKFDFLTQEFNREANTLCSKANYTALTGIGLDLKTVIDQMREQVQNVE